MLSIPSNWATSTSFVVLIVHREWPLRRVNVRAEATEDTLPVTSVEHDESVLNKLSLGYWSVAQTGWYFQGIANLRTFCRIARC